MVLEPVLCPTCQSSDVVRQGPSAQSKPRYKCRNPECRRCTFILNYTYRGGLPEVKQQICDMALNGSAEGGRGNLPPAHFLGIRDTARVLKISPSTVLEELKKRSRPEDRQ